MSKRPALLFRVVDDEGTVLLAQEVFDVDQAGIAAVESGDRARELIERGVAVHLEVMDPDGDIFPAGRWVRVVSAA